MLTPFALMGVAMDTLPQHVRPLPRRWPGVVVGLVVLLLIGWLILVLTNLTPH